MTYVRAVVYLRISEDRSGEELGVQRQREDCLALCALRGWEVAAVHVDNDVSAYSGRHRPGFEDVLADIAAGGVGAVVAWDLTRLTRNTRDRARLIEVCVAARCSITLVRGAEIDPSTPTGALLAGVLGEVSSFESAHKADRQRRAVLQAAQQGRRVGGRRPFGYDGDGLTIREDEAAAVRAGYEALLAGVPLAQVARDWNAAGHVTPQSRRDGSLSPWSRDAVRGVLVNPRYAGLRGHGPVPARGRRRIEVAGRAVWEGLVPEETWRAAVELLADPARRTAPRSGRALLSGLGLCGVCGATVHGSRNPQGQRTYRCSASTGHIARQAEPVDEWVGEVVVARLSRDDAADLLVDDTRPDAEELGSRALALRTRLDGLARLFSEGVLTETGVRQQSAELRTELAAVEAEQADAGRVDVLGPLVRPGDVAAARAAWEALDVPRRRRVVETLAVVTLLPPGRGTRTFRPETVHIGPVV